MIRCGLIGFGYWGPNLARNFHQCSGSTLVRIADTDPRRLAAARDRYPDVDLVPDARGVTRAGDLDAVAIATPISTHFELAMDALDHGKHVFVEKPMADSVDRAEKLAAKARETGRLLMVDHTFVFTEPVRWMRDFLDAGKLGDLLYFDSIRTNLGLFQRDVSVLWDLAPHDLSVIQDLVPHPVRTVSATGACHAGSRVPDIAYVTLDFGDGCLAHIHVSWLSPVKVRRMLVAGSKNMIIFDDMETSEKLKIYDSGVSIEHQDVEGQHKMMVEYRIGDMRSPAIHNREALATEIDHFVAAVEGREECRSGPDVGLQNVRILQAAQRSMDSHGSPIPL